MLEFNVPAMSCGHCVDAVTRAVKTLDPGATVIVDLANHRVQVETAQGRDAVAGALTDAGYEPQPA